MSETQHENQILTDNGKQDINQNIEAEIEQLSEKKQETKKRLKKYLSLMRGFFIIKLRLR